MLGEATEGEPLLDSSFYEAVGRALTAWSEVEYGLSWLFGALMDFRLGGEEGVAGTWGWSNTILHSIDGMQPRIKIVDNVLQNFLDFRWAFDSDHLAAATDFKDRWKPIKKDLEAATKNRNFIAHWRTDVGVDENGLRKPYLIPASSHPRSLQMRRANDTSYDEIYIKKCRFSFEQLSKDLIRFSDELTASEIPLFVNTYGIRAVMNIAEADMESLFDILRTPYNTD